MYYYCYIYIIITTIQHLTRVCRVLYIISSCLLFYYYAF